MAQRGHFWLIAGGLVLLVGHRLASIYGPPLTARDPLYSLLVTEIGAVGLALTILGVALALLGRLYKLTHEPPGRLLIRGAIFGIVAGLIVGALFPAKDALDIYTMFYRMQRLLAFSALVGGGIYVILHLVADDTTTRMVTRGEQILAMATGFIAVFVCGVWVAMELPRFGPKLCQSTFGSIDLVGISFCRSGGAEALMKPRDDIPSIAAALVGLYFFMVACYENNTWRLSFARSIIVIGGTLVAGFTLFEIVDHLHGEGGLLKGAGKLATFGPFLLGLAAYAALFSFWVTWSKHHALVEALSKSFGSTDGFRKMVDGRLKNSFDVPPRGQSLYGDVRTVVNRAEDNGWIEGLIVNARRSKPEDLRLAKLADKMGLGIQPAATDNLKKAVVAVTGKADAAEKLPTEQLETIIRQFSALEPADRRKLEARLESRICRIITPRNEGTGWLVGPDLVLTNYHVVKEMVAERPTIGGAQVTCQFDFKIAGGMIIKGSECHLDPDRPVADWSPYSQVDLGDSEDLPTDRELDFALLRLDRKMGELPIGGLGEDDAPKRGWISLKKAMDQPDVYQQGTEPKMLLYVLQHPYGGPLKGECGAFIAVNGNGTRIRHEATTERGSSGSPCFNFSNLEPVALHHAGRHSRTLNKPFNQAVPLSRILKFLRDNGKVEPFWDLSPGGADKPFERWSR